MRYVKSLLYVSLMILLIIWRPILIVGQEKAFDFGGADSKEPIHVVSNELEIFRGEGKAIYRGDVVAKQGASTLYSDTLTIFFDTEKDEVKRIIAKGHVKILSEGRTATAGRAEFDNLTQTVTLMDQPTIIQGKDIIKGSKITYFLNEERSIVESEPGQKVKTTIYPKKETEKGEEGKKSP